MQINCDVTAAVPAFLLLLLVLLRVSAAVFPLLLLLLRLLLVLVFAFVLLPDHGEVQGHGRRGARGAGSFLLAVAALCGPEWEKGEKYFSQMDWKLSRLNSL